MGHKLFCGNLPFKTTEAELRDLFADSGEVVEVAIPTDRATGRPRGFAFVTMGSEDEAQRAIDNLNNQPFGGRTIGVSIAKPKEGGGYRGGSGRGGDYAGAGRREPRW